MRTCVSMRVYYIKHFVIHCIKKATKSEATSTLLCFKLKMHQYCCVSAGHPHLSSVFVTPRQSSLETLLFLFHFENCSAASYCGREEMKAFGKKL